MLICTQLTLELHRFELNVFKKKYILQYYKIHGLLNPQMWNHE